MDELCYICGVSGTDRELSEGIHDSGIVKICDECSRKDGIPKIKKVEEVEFRKALSAPRFREEFDRARSDFKMRLREIENRRKLSDQEVELKDIIEKNRKANFSDKKRENLVDNFHWILMRARRSRKISQQQLAKEIVVPETDIVMAEKGFLPENYEELVRKLESSLNVQLLKEKVKDSVHERLMIVLNENIAKKKQEGIEIIEPVKELSRELSVNKKTMREMTIADLKEMQRRKLSDEKNEEENEDSVVEEGRNAPRKLTQKEMDDLIFGRM